RSLRIPDVVLADRPQTADQKAADGVTSETVAQIEAPADEAVLAVRQELAAELMTEHGELGAHAFGQVSAEQQRRAGTVVAIANRIGQHVVAEQSDVVGRLLRRRR